MLASNTSGLSITEIADATQRPDQVVGFHFFWPASVMRLIEVVEGEETSPETVQAAMTFAQQIRKVPIRGGRVPRLRRQPHHALHRLGGVALPGRERASVEQLDELIKEKAHLPMGPFRVADMSGLDTALKVAQDMQRRLRRPLLRPPRDAGARGARRAGREEREGVL